MSNKPKKNDSNTLKNILCAQLIPHKRYIVEQNIVPSEGFKELTNPKNWARRAKCSFQKFLDEGIDYDTVQSNDFYFKLGDESLVNERCIVRSYENRVLVANIEKWGDSIQDVWIITDETDTKLICISINVD